MRRDTQGHNPRSAITSAPCDIHLVTTDALLADLIGGRVGYLTGTAVTAGSGPAICRRATSMRSSTGSAHRRRRHCANEQATAAGQGRSASLGRLHAYGRPSAPPASFMFVPGKPVTLLDGVKGSGATSIVNTTIGCLTRHLIWSQRPPEEGPLDFARDDGTTTTHPRFFIRPPRIEN
jgi:hypothetical protein